MSIQLENAVSRYSKMILNELSENEIECWLAGGAIRDYFMGKPVTTDYDLFFPSEENYFKCLNYLKSKMAEIIWESENGCKLMYAGKKYDLVKHFFKDPKECIENFDFTVSMFAVDINQVYFGETTFIDLAKRQLMINKLPFPASSLSRAFRYYKKGFFMCQGEMKKLVEAIQSMPKVENNQPENQSEQIEVLSGDAFFVGFD
jgi:hypothetical protein